MVQRTKAHAHTHLTAHILPTALLPLKIALPREIPVASMSPTTIILKCVCAFWDLVNSFCNISTLEVLTTPLCAPFEHRKLEPLFDERSEFSPRSSSLISSFRLCLSVNNRNRSMVIGIDVSRLRSRSRVIFFPSWSCQHSFAMVLTILPSAFGILKIRDLPVY